MNHKLWLCTGLLALAGGAQADEMARVLSRTAVTQQVPVTRQVCGTQQVVTQQPRSGAGALVGALAGGAIGNSVGSGGGRALATMVGVIGGAAVGNQIEGGGSNQVRNVQQCSNQTVYENRTVWNVVYEYAGQQYAAQMANDPGSSIRLQIAPANQPQQTTYAPTYTEQPTYAQPTYVQPVYVQPTYTYVQPAYAPPVYAAPYYAPVGLSLNLGWSNWGHRHYGGHGHWGH